MTTDSEALLACHCGRAADPIFRPGRIPFIECKTCNIEESGETEAEAIAAWNTRAQITRLATPHDRSE